MKNIAKLLVAVCLGFGTSVLPTVTYATDVNTTAEQLSDSSQFVRIGLHKTVVIRLPANARDVVVGNADLVEAIVRRKDTAYLIGKFPGQTNVFFFDADGNQILALDLEVAVDPLPMRKLLKRALPGTGITVDTMGTSVVLGGTASNVSEAHQAEEIAKKFVVGTEFSGQVVNTIKISGDDQVMLKVKVVEIQRDVLKQFGVDLQALFKMGEVAFNIASVNPFNSTPLSPSGGYAATDKVGDQKFDSVIRAMEGDGLLRTLAEPNLSAVSGQEATFHAGGEFPFEVCDNSQANILKCEIKFKEYGVNLKFTPTVLSEGRINLKILTEVSELSTVASGSQSVPSLNNRKAETTLEMPSGGTMMIAGLISQSTRQNLNGTPGLRKVPLLGNLFRSREFVANETELAVLVTPYLVKPAAAGKFVTPDKNFNASTERQALFFGRLNKVYGTSGKAPSSDYNGNVGFIVE